MKTNSQTKEKVSVRQKHESEQQRRERIDNARLIGWSNAPASVEPEAAHKVLYSQQCRTFAGNSIERCALCLNHPGEHSFPVTIQRDKARAACEEVESWFNEWNIEIGAAEEQILGVVRAAIAQAEGK